MCWDKQRILKKGGARHKINFFQENVAYRPCGERFMGVNGGGEGGFIKNQKRHPPSLLLFFIAFDGSGGNSYALLDTRVKTFLDTKQHEKTNQTSALHLQLSSFKGFFLQ